MKPPADPPPGHIAIPVAKAVVLLTYTEYVRGRKRGTWWKPMQAVSTREGEAVPLNTKSAEETPTRAAH